MVAFATPTGDDAPDSGSQSVIERYVQASSVQQDALRGIAMDVDISAEMPKLKKKGRLEALRTITRLGRITYDVLRFEGDNTIKKEVIARYLAVEAEASSKTAPPITPEHYRFKYKGIQEREGFEVHLFQVTPKRKLAGTFKGELWLDRESCLPIREAGRLAKNPSVFIKRFDFVRTYEIVGGVALPKHTTGTVETRLWGKAEMNIGFKNITRLPNDTVTVASDSPVAKSDPR